MSDILEIFLELVQIDSVSGEEREVSSYIKSRLAKIGMVFSEDQVGNLYWHFDGSEMGTTLYCAHMDTVEPGRGINPKMIGGYIKSEGNTILGADNKAYVAALIYALEKYNKLKGHLPNIEVVFSVKEETGGGMDNFPKNLIRSKKAYLFDYGRELGRVVVAAPYIYNFKIKLKGKAAHSTRPEEGCNAITVAVNFVNKFAVGKFDDGKTTVNVGKICGGSGTNTIPEDVEIWGEIRSTDESIFEARVKEVEKILQESVASSGVVYDLTFDGYCPGYDYKEDCDVIKMLKPVYDFFNINMFFDRSTGVSDANPLSAMGITAIALSDGVENAHTKDEKISIKNLETLGEIVLRMFEEIK